MTNGYRIDGLFRLQFLSHLTTKLKTEIKGIAQRIKGSNRDSLFYLRGLVSFSFIFIAIGPLFISSFRVDALGQPSAIKSSGVEGMFISARERTIYPFPGVVINNNALFAAIPTNIIAGRTLASFSGVEDLSSARGGIIEYTAQEGDTPSSVAQKFNLSLNTVLWANDLNSKSKLKPGQNLIILPVDGVVYNVKNGDTINQIAKIYQAKIEDIKEFNGLSGDGDIYLGDVLIVPDGKMPIAPSVIVSVPQIPLASSYFICPLGSVCNLTQGLHWYNAVDIKGDCGQPIFAAAEGIVQKVALTSSTSKWALNGAGNHITVLHPNGVITYYGHVRTSLVSPGQQVSQGQMIATVGGLPGTPGAGFSTGCHVHFGVTGARNPFAK